MYKNRSKNVLNKVLFSTIIITIYRKRCRNIWISRNNRCIQKYSIGIGRRRTRLSSSRGPRPWEASRGGFIKNGKKEPLWVGIHSEASCRTRASTEIEATHGGALSPTLSLSLPLSMYTSVRFYMLVQRRIVSSVALVH